MNNRVHLFPLGQISLQTGIQKPLNIFEPRYLQMIEDSMKADIPVALVYGKTDLEAGDLEIPHEIYGQIKPIAGLGVPRMIQKSEDGTMVIMLPGEHKGRITKIVKTDTPYIVAEYEMLEEELKLNSENILLLRRLTTKLSKWIDENMRMPGQKEAILGQLNEPCRVVGLYCEFIIDDPCVKQKVLEIDDVNEKIHFLALNS
jgi:Lon protease-like protein